MVVDKPALKVMARENERGCREADKNDRGEKEVTRASGRVDDERERALFQRIGGGAWREGGEGCFALPEVTYPWTVSCLEYGIAR